MAREHVCCRIMAPEKPSHAVLRGSISPSVIIPLQFDHLASDREVVAIASSSTVRDALPSIFTHSDPHRELKKKFAHH